MKLIAGVSPSSGMKYIDARVTGLLIITLICSCMSAPPLLRLIESPGRGEYYSHILLIPIVSLYLLFSRWNSIRRYAQYSGHSVIAGLAVLAIGILFYGASWAVQGRLSQNDLVSLVMVSSLMVWGGGILALYGKEVIKYNAFAIAFLLFMVPLPDGMMEFTIQLLRVGSTEAANWIFSLSGVPYFQSGFAFHFSNLSTEVACECSGIRSFIALLITGVLASHYTLKSGWAKFLLILSIAPIAMLKNGMRIATLSLMGNYVDKRILDSDLHRKGGIPFFLVALVILFCVITILKKAETRKSRS
jgi:exosortase